MADEQDFLTWEDAAKEIGCGKSTLYNYVNTLGIQRHKFILNKRIFLARTDVERIKQVKEKPWLKSGETKGGAA